MSFSKTSLFLLFLALASAGIAATEFKEAEITTIKNMVEHDPGSGAAPAKVNEKIKEKSKVSTAAASMAELTFADSSITRMGANTQFSFQSKERLVKLESGTVLVHTPPGNGGATVDCGGVTGAVSGTTFMASRDANGNAMFILLEGQGALKVTVGGSSVVIRPGQAASVGADVIQEAKNNSTDSGARTPGPSAGPAGDERSAGPASPGTTATGGGENGGTPSSTTPKIQVFEVDVKKIVTTSPLITGFSGELPSVSKIEKVIEVQQQAVQEGKLEKLEVEVVAVKSSDGDILVGAPKVEPEDFTIVNKNLDVVGLGTGGGGSLDIETAAGGGMAAAAPRTETPAPALPRSTPPPVNPGQIVGGNTPPPTPSRLDLSFGSGTGVVTLDRAVNTGQTVNFAGVAFPGLALTTGASSGSFLFDPQDYFLGFDAERNLVTARLVTATMGNLSDTALFSLDPAAIQAANPVRRMLGLASVDGIELAALDAFFYFRNAASGVPANFYQSFRTRTLDLGLTLPAGIRSLAGSQDFAKDYLFAGQMVSRPNSAVALAAPQTVFYADQIRLGSESPLTGISPNWLSLVNSPASWNIPDDNPVGASQQLTATGWNSASLPWAARLNLEISPTDSLGAYLGDFSAYLRHTTANGESRTVRLFDRIGATTLDPSGSPANGLNVTLSDWEPANINQQDTAGILVGPLTGNYRPEYGGWPVSLNDLASLDPNGTWTLFVADLSSGATGKVENWSLELASFFQPQHTISLTVPAGTDRTVTFASGDAGTSVISTRFLADGAGMEFMSSGSVTMKQAQLENLGPKFTLEAAGKVSLGAAPAEGARAVDENQVRILANGITDAGGSQAPAPGSMAVIRSGDSLELRNVTIRRFAGTELATVSGGTTTGRVLMSGSSVRDFKIKELVGAAVNADARIQLAALDNQGGLGGEMLVEEGLPVATKLAKQIDSTVTGPLGDLPVHAGQVDLAARTVKFNEATVTAMSALTARANTILIQNSFMTVVQNSGMINMYVQTGLVNRTWGTTEEGYLNFAGSSTFRIGNVLNFTIANSDDILGAINTGKMLENVSTPQAGKVNVLKL